MATDHAAVFDKLEVRMCRLHQQIDIVLLSYLEHFMDVSKTCVLSTENKKKKKRKFHENWTFPSAG